MAPDAMEMVRFLNTAFSENFRDDLNRLQWPGVDLDFAVVDDYSIDFWFTSVVAGCRMTVFPEAGTFRFRAFSEDIEEYLRWEKYIYQLAHGRLTEEEAYNLYLREINGKGT